MENFAEKFYKISGKRLYDLLMAESKLLALEAGGVDNWSGFEQALDYYVKDGCNKYDLIFHLGIPKEAKEDFQLFSDWESREIIKSYAECE